MDTRLPFLHRLDFLTYNYSIFPPHKPIYQAYELVCVTNPIGWSRNKDYIYSKDEIPDYVIFADKLKVECHLKGQEDHSGRVEGWGAHYRKICQVVYLLDVNIDDTKKMDREEEAATKKCRERGLGIHEDDSPRPEVGDNIGIPFSICIFNA